MPTTSPSTDATPAHWDALAGSYDDAKRRNPAYLEAIIALVDRHVPPPCRGSVMEVGCGTGTILASLRPREGLGIDLSSRMIEQARARHAATPQLRFQVLDATRAAEQGRFDAVISVDLLEHVADWRAVVAALTASCHSGAVIVILTPNPSWALPLWVLEKLRMKMPEGPHRFVHRREVAAELQHQGCRIEHCGTSLLVPAKLLGAGPAISRAAQRIPVLRKLGVIQCVVARCGSEKK